MKASSHNVYLIGAGLSEKHLTMDAVKALRKCDIILFDRLVDQKIITDLKCRKIYVGKKPGESLKQGRINKLLLDYARAGHTVGRLKGGDPFLFSRGFEEYDFLQKKGLDVKVIPGISAFQALAELGIPVTFRGGSSSVALITGSAADGKPDYSGLCADTLVFYMPVGNLHRIVESVRKVRKNAYCMLIENAGRSNYRIISGRLDDIHTIAVEAHVESPALFIASTQRKMLYGRKVLTFRQKSREEETFKQLKGFDVVNYPLYSVKHRKIRKPSAGYIAFTSPNAVESVLSQHKLAGKFIAIGERTGEALAAYGIKAVVPKTQSSTGLMKLLGRYDHKETVVYCSPHTNVLGFKRVFAYDIRYKEKAPGLKKLVKETDIVFITSSDILVTLSKLVPKKLLNQKTIAVIGPKTAATAKNEGLHVDFTLEKPLIKELVKLR